MQLGISSPFSYIQISFHPCAWLWMAMVLIMVWLFFHLGPAWFQAIILESLFFPVLFLAFKLRGFSVCSYVFVYLILCVAFFRFWFDDFFGWKRDTRCDWGDHTIQFFYVVSLLHWFGFQHMFHKTYLYIIFTILIDMISWHLIHQFRLHKVVMALIKSLLCTYPCSWWIQQFYILCCNSKGCCKILFDLLKVFSWITDEKPSPLLLECLNYICLLVSFRGVSKCLHTHTSRI